jgi:hypothetical protein
MSSIGPDGFEGFDGFAETSAEPFPPAQIGLRPEKVVRANRTHHSEPVTLRRISPKFIIRWLLPAVGAQHYLRFTRSDLPEISDAAPRENVNARQANWLQLMVLAIDDKSPRRNQNGWQFHGNSRRQRASCSPLPSPFSLLTC